MTEPMATQSIESAVSLIAGTVVRMKRVGEAGSVVLISASRMKKSARYVSALNVVARRLRVISLKLACL